MDTFLEIYLSKLNQEEIENLKKNNYQQWNWISNQKTPNK